MLLSDKRQDVLAFDRASSRVFDADGHLHVKRTPISKANVCEYWGREIPDYQALGLDGDRRYALLRDPEELAKAADSFNGKPLLFDHNPVSADDHDHDRTVGALSNPAFEAPYLYADLSCWSGPAIRLVQDGTQKELSSAYRYTADMTPGTFEGVRYDGVMRGITANHVALVKKGRAGPDVVVGDAAISERFIMAKHTLSGAAAQTQGALAVYLRPKLAQDAKIDLGAIVSGLTSKNFKARQGKLAHDLKKAVTGKLAQDASLEDVGEVIEALAEILPEEVPEVVEEMGGTVDEPVAEDEASEEEVMAFLKTKLSDEQLAKVKAMLGGADEPAAPASPPAMDKNMVTKTAMDAAIAAASKAAEARATERAVRTQQEICDAERTVRPWVGDLAMAHDSAEGVYRTALTSLGVDVEGVHPSAFLPILKAQPKVSDAPKRASAPVAQDAASVAETAKMFPHMNRLGA